MSPGTEQRFPMRHAVTAVGLALAVMVSLACIAKLHAAQEFKGKIELDVRDSVADWTPYELKRAPEGAPNILFVLYDDTGLGAWSAYGGRINMPTLDRLPLAGKTLEKLERAAIKQTLDQTGGNKSKAARVLGIASSTLYEKIKKYGL